MESPLREHLSWERFLAWLEALGDRPCGDYLSATHNVVCRYLRQATPLLGATLYPGESRDSDVIAAFVPWDDGWVELAPVSDLPAWVHMALAAEEELYDEAAGAQVPASRLLERLKRHAPGQ